MRVLFIGDNHCDDNQVRSRSDNYLEACLAELFECLQIARDRQCDAVVFLGDLFNRMEVGGACRNGVLRTLIGDENGAPWPFRRFITVGNHDIAHNPQNLDRSALGTLLEAGLLEKVDYDETLGIGFAHFEPHIEERMGEGSLLVQPALIWSAHASIVTQSIFGTHIFFSDLPLHSVTKLVVAGHVHMPMAQTRADGVRFVNPGNVGRNAATKENMNRPIEVLLVDYARDGSRIDTEMIPLQSALPAAEVFKVEEIQAAKDEQADRKEFIQQVGQMSGLVSFASVGGDKYESIRMSGQIKSIETRVVDMAVEAVREVNDRRKGKTAS